jgi:biotin transport system substrate-specific component
MAEKYESVELVGDRTVEYFALSVVVAALTAAFAQVTVPYPFSPAPFTLQTMGVYLGGLLLGPLWGAFALLVYIIAGAAGAPIFAGGGAGVGILVGPTGGYLVSFPIAAALIGAIVHRRVEPRRLDSVSIVLQVSALIAGLAVVYLIGSVWLAFSTGQSLSTGIVQGALVFVPGDLAKAVVVMGLITGGYFANARGILARE